MADQEVFRERRLPQDVPPPPVAPPPVGEPVVGERVVGDRIVGDRVVEDRDVVRDVAYGQPAATERVASFSRLTPARLVTAAGAVVLLVIGLIAIAKAGLGAPLDEPVVSVAGMNHTALLGIVGAAFGLVLLAAATLPTDVGSRGSSIFFGTLLGIGGIVAIATPESFKSLALESSYGWMCVIIAAAIVLANLVLPTVATRKVTYR